MNHQTIATDLHNSDDTPPTRRLSHRSWEKAEKRFVVFSLLGIALFAVSLLWWGRLNELPDYKIPSAALPSPNAFDTHSQAILLMAPMPKVAVDPIFDSEDVKDRKERARRYSLKRKAAWIAQNAPAFKVWRQGLKQPYVTPPVRSFSALLPYLAPYRELGRRVQVESDVYALRGDGKRAANSALDIVRFGQQVPRGGILIHALVGQALQRMGQRQLTEVLPKLNAVTCKNAIRQLEQLQKNRPTSEQCFREEKWCGQAALSEMMRKPDWGNQLSAYAGGAAVGTPANWGDKAKILLLNKGTVLKNYTHYMDALIAESKKPFVEKKTVPIPSDPINQMLAPAIDNVFFNFTRTETGTNLLLAALALRAYKLEHGTYPEDLAMLSPTYLRSVPSDPFGKSALRYKKQGAGYLLWSIGPDKKDNGGQPIKQLPTNTRQYRYEKNPDDSAPRDAAAQGDWRFEVR